MRPARSSRTAARLAGCVLAPVVTFMLFPATPAAASTDGTDPFGDSLFTDLRMGSRGNDVGDIWVKRQADESGTGEELLVHIDVISPGVMRESSVCITDTAFTGRELGVGGCSGRLVQQDNDGASSTDYEIDLGTTFEGEVLYCTFPGAVRQELEQALGHPGSRSIDAHGEHSPES